MSDRGMVNESSVVTRLCMWSARHRRLMVLGWVGLVVLAMGACSALPVDTDVNETPPGESGEAFQLYKDRFQIETGQPQEFVVFSHPTLTVDDPLYQQTVDGLLQDLRTLVATEESTVGSTTLTSSRRVASNTTSHYDFGLPRDASPFVATNETGGDVTFAIVELADDANEAADHADAIVDTVADAEERSDGFRILVGGGATLNKQVSDIIDEDFARASTFEFPIMIAILIIAFGAVVAALVPVILALAAIVVANGALAVISHGYALSEIYIEMVLLMGLATGIDYALFVITRYRRERAAGLSQDDALRVASATSGKAVAFAGATVVLAISGMFLVESVIFRSLALAAIAVVVLAIIISMTLLPALLALLGDNLDRLRIPFLGRPTGESGGFWGAVTDRVLARPGVLATVTLVALLAVALPVTTFNLGFNGAKSYSDDVEGKKAVLALEESFTIGLLQPSVVVLDAGEQENVFGAEIQAALRDLEEMVRAEDVTQGEDNFFGVLAQQPDINNAGDTEAVFIPINADTGEDRAIDAVNHLRDDLIPVAFREAPGRALVTGDTAANIDFRDMIYQRTPVVFAFVLGLAFFILLLMFRSIVIPLKAIVLNALSVGAAYGVLVLVFQEGWPPGIEDVLGFEATGIVESWLPLFLFAILFGLSMDYHMFILGRVKEAYERGARNEEAVSIGIKATAGTITSAAAIMVAVFAIFAFTRDIGLKQFGVGLGVAVLVDATVIRAVLLPASMKLLGDLNWYLPSWLEWIPHVRMAE